MAILCEIINQLNNIIVLYKLYNNILYRRHGMKINDYKKHNNGLFISTTEGTMKLIPYDENIIRVTYTLKDDFSNKESLAVTAHPKTDINWSVEEVDNQLVLSTKALTISINKETGSFQYLNSKGETITVTL